MRARRGWTLIELLVSLVLLGTVGAATTKVLIGSQRLARNQAGQAVLQANVRTGVWMVLAELREVGVTAAASDIYGPLSANAIKYRAMRSTGIACQVTTTAVRVRNAYWSGPRTPVAVRDSLMIFAENLNATTTDDAWIPAPITGAGTASTCPDAAAATQYPTILTAAQVTSITGGAANPNMDAPVRTFEVMELALVASGGKTYLGARSWSAREAVYTPVLGPVIATNGLAFSYLKSDGTAATTVTGVRMIEITVRGLGDALVSSASTTRTAPEDRLIARIRLRNAPSP